MVLVERRHYPSGTSIWGAPTGTATSMRSSRRASSRESAPWSEASTVEGRRTTSCGDAGDGSARMPAMEVWSAAAWGDVGSSVARTPSVEAGCGDN